MLSDRDGDLLHLALREPSIFLGAAKRRPNLHTHEHAFLPNPNSKLYIPNSPFPLASRCHAERSRGIYSNNPAKHLHILLPNSHESHRSICLIFVSISGRMGDSKASAKLPNSVYKIWLWLGEPGPRGCLKRQITRAQGDSFCLHPIIMSESHKIQTYPTVARAAVSHYTMRQTN